jgi:hypothetical protein
MALGTPSESPAVVVREIDLTGGVPNVQSTTGAIVGKFRWGPVDERTRVSNEAELVSNFGSPTTSENIDFLSATQFLRYSSSMQVVRTVNDSAFNSIMTRDDTLSADSISGTLANQLIKNSAHWDASVAGLESLVDSVTNYITFVAKYPGELGNSIKVSYCGAIDSADSAQFSNWDYQSAFDRLPGTTTYAQKANAKNDELHLAIIDEDGKISGTRGTILETFPSLSIIKGAQSADGSSIYVKDVVNERSQYLWMANFDSDLQSVGAGSLIVDNKDYSIEVDSATHAVKSYSGLLGADGSALGLSEYMAGYDMFEDKDQVEVDFLIAPGLSSREDQVSIVNDLTSTAMSTRKDCVVVASPARTDIVNVTADADKVTNAVNTAKRFTNSSYLVVDNNYLKVYDKYNDQYVEIPAASTVAGIMAATDYNRAPWFSPAGGRRGQLLGVTALNYSPTKAQRDTLYKAGINPIANIPGQGTILFGDKTFLNSPSAFDRINVRRLFLVLERAVARAAENVLFEFNDEFTRAEFVNIIEPVLREVKGRRGITDFRVVADETNNTPAVIDRNEFVASIFIKPARSINYVTLNFVAVRTGVDFEEVVGTV